MSEQRAPNPYAIVGKGAEQPPRFPVDTLKDDELLDELRHRRGPREWQQACYEELKRRGRDVVGFVVRMDL